MIHYMKRGSMEVVPQYDDKGKPDGFCVLDNDTIVYRGNLASCEAFIDDSYSVVTGKRR